MQKFQCPKCSSSLKLENAWMRCTNCHAEYPEKDEIAFLLGEEQLGWADKRLRDDFYNGLLGKFYQRLMPLLSLPARPISISKLDWFIFGFTWCLIIASAYFTFFFVLIQTDIVLFLVSGFVLLSLVIFFVKHHHFLHLLWTAIPAKFSLERDKYVYKNLFQRFIRPFKMI